MAFLFDDDTTERHYLYEDDQTDYGGQKQLFDTASMCRLAIR